MAITRKQLQVAIQNAKFPIGKRPIAEEIVWNGLELFREFKTPRYFSHTGKLVKKSQSAHKTLMGRYNQRKARTILISALCRAWLEAFKKKPQLNNKADSMTAFHHFAQEVMAHEGRLNNSFTSSVRKFQNSSVSHVSFNGHLFFFQFIQHAASRAGKSSIKAPPTESQ